jgi:hypothetical protein
MFLENMTKQKARLWAHSDQWLMKEKNNVKKVKFN